MNYKIAFDGAASAELTQLVNAVQRQLNWRNLHLQAAADVQPPTDAAARTAVHESASTSKPGKPCGPCPDTHGGHGPYFLAGAVLGLLVGLTVGYFLGKRSASTTSRS